LATVSAAFLTKRALDWIKIHADVSVLNEQDINADVSSDQSFQSQIDQKFRKRALGVGN
jgi:hypothetical protein